MPLIHKVEITVYKISTQLESAIRRKSLDEEQIADAYQALSEKKKKQVTSVKIGAIVMTVFALIIGISTIIAAEDYLLVGFLCLFGTLALAAVAAYIGYYVNVGKVAKQWNALLKENYPDISDKYKL